ncbi:hypothetical protein P692DRAFT_20736932 [Suillus brevipes Sb2]|nr:hypothetical protein P692DRAFT_20736932 [Suillus brevipes Sb2]
MASICMYPRTLAHTTANLTKAELHSLHQIYSSGMLTAMTGPSVGASIAEKTHNVKRR